MITRRSVFLLGLPAALLGRLIVGCDSSGFSAGILSGGGTYAEVINRSIFGLIF